MLVESPANIATSMSPNIEGRIPASECSNPIMIGHFKIYSHFQTKRTSYICCLCVK